MGVVGVGRIGLTHAENIARGVRGARLTAVTTANEGRAEQARQRCGDVAVYPGLVEMLEAEKLDAVCIASSTSAHVDNVVQCATAGVHIFCEKPLALTLADCDRAIAAAEDASVKLMVGHVRMSKPGATSKWEQLGSPWSSEPSAATWIHRRPALRIRPLVEG